MRILRDLFTWVAESVKPTRSAAIGTCLFLAVFGIGIGTLFVVVGPWTYLGLYTPVFFMAFGITQLVALIEVIRYGRRGVTSKVATGLVLLASACTVLIHGLVTPPAFTTSLHRWVFFAGPLAVGIGALIVVVCALRKSEFRSRGSAAVRGRTRVSKKGDDDEE